MAKKRGRPKGSKSKRGSKKPGPKKGSKRKGTKRTTATTRGSREARYKAEGRKQGWNMGNWDKAKKDTLSCANQANKKKDPIQRMRTYNKCRSAKKLRK